MKENSSSKFKVLRNYPHPRSTAIIRTKGTVLHKQDLDVIHTIRTQHQFMGQISGKPLFKRIFHYLSNNNNVSNMIRCMIKNTIHWKLKLLEPKNSSSCLERQLIKKKRIYLLSGMSSGFTTYAIIVISIESVRVASVDLDVIVRHISTIKIRRWRCYTNACIGWITGLVLC